MRIFILQKAITDLKSPVKRIEYETAAVTVKDFISEMVRKNFESEVETIDRIALFDELIESGSNRFAYGERKRKDFTLGSMTEFALLAFEDSIYLIQNVTQSKRYEALEQEMKLKENDEIALIKLKYMRGAI